ncbi:MAG: hypothetical protein JJE22_09705 [Bacteroidia bacterium]|nr:hypothetical protein [Bacteroidia bacterium]
MMSRLIRNNLTVTIFLLLAQFCSAQNNTFTSKRDSTPYRIISSGKQITVKSSKDIKNIMVWTASGHRILEHKDVNASIYSFRISINEKIFFLMLQMIDGKVYSEKIGVQ